MGKVEKHCLLRINKMRNASNKSNISNFLTGLYSYKKVSAKSINDLAEVVCNV